MGDVSPLVVERENLRWSILLGGEYRCEAQGRTGPE
jgi:hypothetical protein